MKLQMGFDALNVRIISKSLKQHSIVFNNFQLDYN